MSVADSIRVLHLVRPATGGIRSHVVNLIRFMPASQTSHTVGAPQELLDDLPIDVAGTRRFCVDIAPGLSPVRDFRAAAAVASIMRRGDFDILHAHGLRSAWIAALARNLTPTLSLERRRRQATWIYTAHNIVRPTVSSRVALGLLSRSASAVIAVSPAVRQALTACGVDLAAIRVIPNGVDACHLSELPLNARESLGVSRNNFVVGCIARLSPEKGVDVLIKVAEKMPEATFLIAGDGPERHHYASHASVNVRLLGRVDDVRLLLAAADVIAIPSREEGQGIVALEAMAAGVPVVASDVGGLSSMLAGGDVATLVPSGDVDALKAALIALHSDTELRNRRMERGRSFVKSQYDVHSTSAQVLQLYRQLPVSPSPPPAKGRESGGNG